MPQASLTPIVSADLPAPHNPEDFLYLRQLRDGCRASLALLDGFYISFDPEISPAQRFCAPSMSAWRSFPTNSRASGVSPTRFFGLAEDRRVGLGRADLRIDEDRVEVARQTELFQLLALHRAWAIGDDPQSKVRRKLLQRGNRIRDRARSALRHRLLRRRRARTSQIACQSGQTSRASSAVSRQLEKRSCSRRIASPAVGELRRSPARSRVKYARSAFSLEARPAGQVGASSSRHRAALAAKPASSAAS